MILDELYQALRLFEDAREAAMRAHGILSPSDHGLDGAIPLPPDEWHPAVTDEGWAAQNRKINELLMGRTG